MTWIVDLQKQLEFIHWLQNFNPTPFVKFIKFLNYFDRPELYMVLIPLIWVFKGIKEGQKLFWIVALSGIINFALKLLFALPRPFHLAPSLGLIFVANPGFPSGAAQQSMIFALLMIQLKPKKWVVAFALFYLFLISFSRVYLGVHFPVDIVGGWTIGIACSLLIYFALPHFKAYINAKMHITIALLYTAAVMLFLGRGAYELAGLCMTLIGATLGSELKSLKDIQLTRLGNTVWYLLALLGIFLIDILSPSALIKSHSFFLLSKFFCMGLWVSLISKFFVSKLSDLKSVKREALILKP